MALVSARYDELYVARYEPTRNIESYNDSAMPYFLPYVALVRLNPHCLLDRIIAVPPGTLGICFISLINVLHILRSLLYLVTMEKANVQIWT